VVALVAVLGPTVSDRPGTPTPPRRAPRGHILLPVESVLDSNLLVTWYGNPHTPKMGVLGEYSGMDGFGGQALKRAIYYDSRAGSAT